MYSILATVVALIHASFILAVFVGIFVSIKVKWFRPVEALVLMMAVGLWSFFAGCPLTSLENFLRVKAAEPILNGGFITHYMAKLFSVEVSDRTVSIMGYLLALSFLILALDWMYNGHIWRNRMDVARRLMKARPLHVLLSLAVLLVFVWSQTSDSVVSVPAQEQVAASAAYAESVTPLDLKQRYAAGKLKILIVPGHENGNGGAVYKGVRESELNLEISKYLYDYLKSDTHLDVSVARDLKTGDFNPVLLQYFIANYDAIKDFATSHILSFISNVATGKVAPVDGAYHNFTKPDVAHRLFGINKWANENNVDLVLHVHFNDHPGHRYNKPGKYSGFTVYVPDSQYSNARVSTEIGQAMSTELQKVSPISNLPQENMSVVPDQDLIAVGAKGTRTGASILIEYGYIYEPQFANTEVKNLILPELAFQTHAGLQRYLSPTALLASSIIPALVSQNLSSGIKGSGQVLMLQKVLSDRGYYPPEGKTLTDCPINGNFGPCVETAVKSFQISNGIDPTGIVGPLTRAKVNSL